VALVYAINACDVLKGEIYGIILKCSFCLIEHKKNPIDCRINSVDGYSLKLLLFILRDNGNLLGGNADS
jgi:hypothetical protein